MTKTKPSKEFLTALENLDLQYSNALDSPLLLVSDLGKKGLAPRQLFTLETASHYKADAVYFRKFEDSRPPLPQIYIYDNTKARIPENDYAEIHRILWSGCVVPLFIIVEKTKVLIFDSRKPVDTTFFNQITADPIETLEISSKALKEYSAKLFDNGTFWELDKASSSFLESTSAYSDLIDGLKKIRRTFLNKSTLPERTAQKLLVLSILVKYLEERGDDGETLFAKNFFKLFGANDFCGVLRQKGKIISLFDKLAEHFNGKIFSWEDPEEIELLKKCDLSILANFLDANTQDNQYVLWRRYSFNHLPVELISSVYEAFLGEGKKDVVYTPHFLVNTLLDECMPLNHPKASFKLVDVSCGSGIFLVSAYKRLVEWWRYSKYLETGVLPPNPKLRILKQILKNSIFGLDIEEGATRLTVFSLSLALCDMLTPKQIWTELKFDDLSNDNIRCSDFFKAAKQGISYEFDLVIGNPPFDEFNEKDFSKLISENEISLSCKIPQNQIALLFLDQAMTLLKPDGLLSLIMPSGPLLYNDTIDFRKYFFQKYNVTQIIDFTNLSSTLFGKANVATSAIFVSCKTPDETDILHITVRRTKSSKEKIFFEIDHYDFHNVTKAEAISDRYIWKANLYGGGRLNYLINRLAKLQTLGEFLKLKKKHNQWIFGDGFIKGKNDADIVPADLVKKKGGYDKAPYLTNSLTFDPEDFDEDGIHRTFRLKDIYFQWKRTPLLFEAPQLLIKKNLGDKSIPITFRDSSISFKNEIIGIHSPLKERSELKELGEYIKNNQLCRFFLSVTSARSGISRSTSTLLQEDIMNIPYPEDKQELGLSYAEKIISDDVLYYFLEQVSKGENASINEFATEKELRQFGNTFSKALNSIYQENNRKFSLASILESTTYYAAIFAYSSKKFEPASIGESKKYELAISELVANQMGKNLRINRILKLYAKDKIYLIKPKQLRYWLKSIALRDADETLDDLQKSGY
jgi:hypothetical protein